MWAMEIYEWLNKVKLTRWGIFPREWDGLVGIITGPFIHSDWGHLLSNSAPILVLTVIMVNFYKRVAIPAYVTIQLGTGFIVWLFARESYHVGASGVVYGLIAFVFWSGVFRRSTRSIILALIIAMVYGGYFQGIVPQEGKNVSWESHLFGGMVGIVVAFLYKNAIEKEEQPRPNPWANETKDTPFLPADTFAMTKYERHQLELARIEAERQARIEMFRRQQEGLRGSL